MATTTNEVVDKGRKITFEGKEVANFLVKLGINVYQGDTLITEPMYVEPEKAFLSDYFFYIYENEILEKEHIFKDKIIGCFDKEMYTEENLNALNEKELRNRVTKDEEYCMFYMDIWKFLEDTTFGGNDDYLYRLIPW